GNDPISTIDPLGLERSEYYWGGFTYRLMYGRWPTEEVTSKNIIDAYWSTPYTEEARKAISGERPLSPTPSPKSPPPPPPDASADPAGSGTVAVGGGDSVFAPGI